MYPKETDKRRCRPEMKFVGDLMYGQVSCHDKPFGSDKDSFVYPALGGVVRDGLDYRGQVFGCDAKFIGII